ncbi:MAG: hypothetical protein ACXVA9_10195 [Bdellovibrionales bacterium]
MRSLAIIALLFSAQAFACPTLTGSYTCTYQDGSKETIAITQDMKGTVTVYNINGSDMSADGTVNPVPDSDNLKEGTFKSWCDDDVTLKGLLTGKYYNGGSYFGDLTMNMDWSLSGTDLKQTSNGEVVNTGGKYPITNETVCSKN